MTVNIIIRTSQQQQMHSRAIRIRASVGETLRLLPTVNMLQTGLGKKLVLSPRHPLLDERFALAPDLYVSRAVILDFHNRASTKVSILHFVTHFCVTVRLTVSDLWMHASVHIRMHVREHKSHIRRPPRATRLLRSRCWLAVC